MKSARWARNADQAAARHPGERVHAAGLDRPVKVDVRILAATNADITSSSRKANSARIILRLNVINVALPPLRERREDIPLLAGHFFTYYCRENNKFWTPPAGRFCISSPKPCKC